jgi:hypothetical protein
MTTMCLDLGTNHGGTATLDSRLLEGAIAATICGSCYPLITYSFALLGLCSGRLGEDLVSEHALHHRSGAYAALWRFNYVRFRDRDGEIADAIANRDDRQKSSTK